MLSGGWDCLQCPASTSLDVVMYCEYECSLLQGRNIHNFESKGRENYQIRHQSSIVFELLLSQIGITIHSSHQTLWWHQTSWIKNKFYILNKTPFGVKLMLALPCRQFHECQDIIILANNERKIQPLMLKKIFLVRKNTFNWQNVLKTI